MRWFVSRRESRVLWTIGLGFLWSVSASADVEMRRIASGLLAPTYLTAPPGEFDRLFVTERLGEIEILDATTGQKEPVPFLSIPGVETLASVAFHPDYASNRFFYVYYRDVASDVHLVRYETFAGNPNQADVSTATVILSQSLPGHFGGWIGFGPSGFLFVHIGDGGDFISHDAPGNGQGITTELKGNILRIDVAADDYPADPLRNYGIPASNPFVRRAGLDEIWAYGLRNPWRGSFDRLTGDYYIADVGQDTREEIDFEPAGAPGGRNYGWRLREGSIATPTGGVGGPQPPGGVDPVYEYVQGTGPTDGDSVTGGYVYRGPVQELQGRYFFGDFANPRIWSIEVDAASESVTEFLDWTTQLTPDVGTLDSLVSFGEDARANLYAVDFDGEIFLITESQPVPFLTPTAQGLVLLALLAGAHRAAKATSLGSGS